MAFLNRTRNTAILIGLSLIPTGLLIKTLQPSREEKERADFYRRLYSGNHATVIFLTEHPYYYNYYRWREYQDLSNYIWALKRLQDLSEKRYHSNQTVDKKEPPPDVM
jgi:hypothetical protein